MAPNMNTVLIVGETGSGKSTFINTLTNYFLDGRFPDNIKVSIDTKFLKSTEGLKNTEVNVKDTTVSQTDDCTHYTFQKKGSPCKYVFIDTPGLSDTRGVQQDEVNMNKIIDAAENATALSAIIIIINGKDCRDVLSLRNAISRLQGSIPDDILNNLVIVFTKCREDNRNFDLKALGNLRSRSMFHMENSAFSTDPKTWGSGKFLKAEFNASMHTVERLLNNINKKAGVSTKVFAEMKDIRFRIKQTLHKAKMDVKRIQSLQDNIAGAQATLGKYANDANQFKNYTTKTVVQSKVMIEVPYHNTICSSCDHVCHQHCGLQEISSKGDNAFQGCAAFCGPNCSICPSRCSYTTHYHGRKEFRVTNETLETEMADMKAKYQQATNGVASTQTQINSVASAKKLADDAIKHMTSEVVQSCKDLKKICKGFNIIDELHITLQQMEMESKMLKSHEARAAADKMIDTIKLISDSLSKDSQLIAMNNNGNDQSNSDDQYDYAP
eukprot:gene21003-25219_t